MNGTTWYDRTNYYETLPATNENLEKGYRNGSRSVGQLLH